MIDFGQPWVLLLLPILLGWTLWRARRLEALGITRRRLVVAARCLLFTLLVLALAQIRLEKVKDQVAVFFALDWSDSIPEDQRRVALQFIQEAVKDKRADDEAGLMIFGREPSIENSPTTLPEFPKDVGAVQSAVPGGRTNIAGALRLALAALPESMARRVVLLSDGNQNFGEAQEAARVAQAGGVPIDVFPLRYLHENDVRVSRLDVPTRVNIQAPFDVRVFVDSDHDTDATLRLYEDDVPIREERVQLRGGIRNVFFIPRSLTRPGFHRYRAEVERPGDTNPENNTAAGFTDARGEPRVLMVDSEPDLASDLFQALRREKIEVDLVTPDSIPTSLSELQSYDSVIFSNVGADALGQDQMEMMERGVHDLGIGFIMVGGPHSFGPGGYQGTPIERLLPVRMDISHRRVLPNGALCVILHTCEIPDGNAWAREVSLAALDVLSARDLFGLLYFGPPVGTDPGQASQYGYNWLSGHGLVPAGDKEQIRTLIKDVQPGDMPDFDQTLQMAYDGLSQVDAALRHIVIISDGDPQPPNPQLTRAIYDAGISISTIVIAPHAPQNAAMMQEIARRHGGNFYYPTSANQLPRIFIREATVVRRSMINEEDFEPQLERPSEALPGFSLGGLPTLSGHVVTEPAAGADVPIVVPESNDPVLAHWRYGLGHTAAFTSDAKARWAGHWLSWSQYTPFWTQLVRWTLRDTAERNFRVTTQVSGSEGLITIDAIGDNDQFINFANFEGRLIPPSYNTEDVKPITFRQTAPGRYEGRFDIDEIGSYMISIATQGSNGQTQLLTAGLSLSYSPEFQTNDTNVQLLSNLARETAGRMNVAPTRVFDHNLPSAVTLTPVWPLMLALAMIALPFDIFLRRVLIDWADIVAVLTWLLKWGRAALVPVRRLAPEKDVTTTALLGVKERVSEETEAGATSDDKRRLQEALKQVKAQRGLAEEMQTAAPRPRVTPRATGGGEAKPLQPAPSEFTGALLRAKARAKKKM